ncbi:MAG: hypothetical protein F7B18_07065 [Desulfurococcales archaeon]|nr:hypothetical protein [Desulfurococcales archaeon]
MRVGEAWLDIHFTTTTRVKGASYKVFKTLVLERCGRLDLSAHNIAVSPLIGSDGDYMLPVLGGWRRSVAAIPTIILKGTYRLRISWATQEATQTVSNLLECIRHGREPQVEITGYTLTEATPATSQSWRIHLATPAQIKVRTITGKTAVTPYPTPTRLLKNALTLLQTPQQTLQEIDHNILITDAEIRKVTVILDPDKPTNWAIQGWLWLTPTPNINPNTLKTIQKAITIIQYTGTGKSRLEGLGQTYYYTLA